MPSAQIPCVEMISLMALSDLEEPWTALMQLKDPESVAVAFRLALVHLAQTSKRLQMADVIQQAEESVGCKVEQETAQACTTPATE